MKHKFWYLVGLIILVGCGGGSGGSSNSTSVDYTLVETPAVYSGKLVQSPITGDQLSGFLGIVLGDQGNGSTLDDSVFSRPAATSSEHSNRIRLKSLKKIIESYAQTSQRASGGVGSFSCADRGRVERQNVVLSGVPVTTLNFIDCLEIYDNGDFLVFHGHVEIFSPPFDTTTYAEFETYQYKTLNVQSRSSSHTLEGGAKSYMLRSPCFQEEDELSLVIRNDRTGVTYRTESFVIADICGEYEDGFNGRIYYPDNGYVDVTTPIPLEYDCCLRTPFYLSGELVFTGLNNTKFKMVVGYPDEFNPNHSYTHDNYHPLYKVSLDLDGEGTSDVFYQLEPELLSNEIGSNLADDDGDGIADGYEILSGLDPSVDDSQLDPDGDGKTNLQAFLFRETFVPLEIEMGFSTNLRANPTAPYPWKTIDENLDLDITITNNSAYMRALDSLLIIEIIPGTPDYYFVDIIADGCNYITPIYLECDIGVIEPGQEIDKDISFVSDTPTTVALNYKIIPRLMWDGQYRIDDWFQTQIEFRNRVSGLFSRLQDFQYSYTDQMPTSVATMQLKLNSHDAHNPRATFEIPENIVVDKIQVFDANDNYLGDCPAVSQPIIVCAIDTILTSSGRDPNFHITSMAQAEGTTIVTMLSESDSTPPPQDTGFNSWEILSGKSLEPYQAQIDTGSDGDTITVPDGLYVGALDFGGKNLTVQSTNGNRKTALWLSTPGITMTNGGTVRGFEFLASRGYIEVTGGTAAIVENRVTFADRNWLDVRQAAITIDKNIIVGHGDLVTTCSAQIASSPGTVLFLFEVFDVTITNNLFVDSVYKDGCNIISYIQDNSGLYIGVLSNNVFYSEANLATTAIHVDLAYFGMPLYIQNNVFYSTGVYDLRGLNDTTHPEVRNNLFFGHREPGNDYYDEFGTGWITEPDPMFIDPTVLNFAVGAGSPVIDSGYNTLAPADDFGDTARPIDGDGDFAAVTDIGAFEYQP